MERKHLQNESGPTWQQFAAEVRIRGCQLLKRLDEFPRSILITGCQRSGTTMLSRIITQSEGMVNYWFGHDDELDAALILSGQVPHEPNGRYCFQTTYVNECYPEYFDKTGGHKIIWVLRNPYSVAYSMLYNWKAYAFDELFHACGASQLRGLEKLSYRLLGLSGLKDIKRACLAYNGKSSHLFALVERLGLDQVMVVDYDDLANNKKEVLSAVYDFVDLPFQQAYADKIHARSLSKADKLTAKETAVIKAVSLPVYQQARQLIRYRIDSLQEQAHDSA